MQGKAETQATNDVATVAKAKGCREAVARIGRLADVAPELKLASEPPGTAGRCQGACQTAWKGPSRERPTLPLRAR